MAKNTFVMAFSLLLGLHLGIANSMQPSIKFTCLPHSSPSVCVCVCVSLVGAIVVVRGRLISSKSIRRVQKMF